MGFEGDDIRTLLSAPRLCAVPFPPYRFTPGRDPHPIADPRGHSHLPPGTPHPTAEYHPPEQWRRSSDYLYGCDLYNHGYWWEAHEAWEGLWRVVPRGSAQHSYLQGLIQVSACHLKLYLGHADGVARLRDSSAAHLTLAANSADPPVMMGIDVQAFLRQTQDYFEICSSKGKGPAAHNHAQYPYLLPE